MNILNNSEIADKRYLLESIKADIIKQKFANDVKYLEYSTLQTLISEEDKDLKEASNSVENNRELIRNKRKYYYDKSRDCCVEYGVSKCVSIIEEFTKKSSPNKEDSAILNDIQEVQSAITDNESLRKFLKDTLSEIDKCQGKIKELTQQNEELEIEYLEGSEITRLRAAVALSKQQKQELEEEYLKLLASTAEKSNKSEYLKAEVKIKYEDVQNKATGSKEISISNKYEASLMYKSFDSASINDIVDVPKMMSELNSKDTTQDVSKKFKYKPQYFKTVDKSTSNNNLGEPTRNEDKVKSPKRNIQFTYRNLHKYYYHKPK